MKCATCRDIFSWWPIFWNCLRWKRSNKEKLKWRRAAAVVGYFDVILSLLTVIGVAACGVFIAIVLIKIEASKKQPAELERERIEAMTRISTKQKPNNDTNSTPSILKTPLRGDFVVSVTLTWVVVGLALAMSFLQLVAAIRMLKATEYDYNVFQAAEPVQFWMYTNVIILLISGPLHVILVGKMGIIGYASLVCLKVTMASLIQHFLWEIKEFTGRKQQFKNIGKM